MIYLITLYCLIAMAYGIYKMVKYTKYFRYNVAETILFIICGAGIAPFVFPMVLINSLLKYKKSKNGK